ncbi:unnamed protein product, partial [marine sediment metagenome]
MVFGWVPGLIFLAFCRIDKEKLFSWIRVKRLLIFSLVTLAVGALGILPQIFNAFKGGMYGRFPKGQAVAYPELLPLFLKFIHPALLVGFGLAVLVQILFFKKQKPSRLVVPLVALLGYLVIFQVSFLFGVNPIGDF